jgi:L-malate glycosyltransferase
MMHLVHLTASLGIGGAESVLLTLVEGLKKTAINQTVIAFRDGPYAKHIRNAGVPVYIIQGAVIRYDPVFWWRLFCTIKRVKPDCIHSLLWASNIAARFLGKILAVPVVSGMHNNTVLYGKLCNIVDRVTLPMACHIVVIHEGVQQSLIARCNKHKSLPVSVIYNCIDIEKVHSQALADPHTRRELGFDEHHFVIGAVGRWIPIKRYPLLIEQFSLVLQRNPHARLVLIGYGSEEVKIRSLIDQLHIQHAVTLVVGKQAYGYFPLFDCFVLPSLTEGPAIALLEAMSFRLPCVVTHDSASHPVIIDRYNGLLLYGTDHDALSNTLITLIGNKLLCKQLGDCAYKIVRSNFSAKAMASSYRAVFMHVTQNNGKANP